MTTILITGANRGLGLEFVKQYAERPNTTIIACCRNPEGATELKALSIDAKNIEIKQLDVADHASIERLGEDLDQRSIDILINNAGIYGKSQPATTGFADQQFGVSDFENDWIMPYRTNVIGPMKVVETFVGHVARSEQRKIIIVTSIVGSIFSAKGFMFGYAASKAAANMVAKNLSIALKNKRIIVNPLHPGYAKTDMGGENAHVEVPFAIAGAIKQIDNMSLEASGEFLSFDDRILPW